MTTWIFLVSLFLSTASDLAESVEDSAIEATASQALATEMRYRGIERLLAKFSEERP